MATTDIAGQFLEAAAKDPSLIKSFGIDPADAVKNATGLELTDNEIGDAIEAISPLLKGEGLNMNAVMELVGDVLGGEGNILEKFGHLFKD